MAISDPRDPVLPSGQLSRSALEAMARQAGNSQALYQAGGSSYVSSVGSVFIPDPASAAASGVAEVRVTSAVRDGTSGYFPAVILSWSDAVAIPGFSPGAACWAQGPNDESLAAQNYNANQMGAHADGKLVFTVATSPRIGSTATIRISSATVDGTSLMWPGFVQGYVDGTPVATTDGMACWVFPPNGGPLLPGFLEGTCRIVHVADGKPVYSVAGNMVDAKCVNGQIQKTTA